MLWMPDLPHWLFWLVNAVYFGTIVLVVGWLAIRGDDL